MKKGKKLTKAEVQFCTAVARGDKSIKACLVECFPKYKTATPWAINRQSERLVSREDIVREIAKIKERFAETVIAKDIISKEEALEMMAKGVREGVKNEPMAIVEFAAILKLMGQWCGWEASKDVTIRNGGLAPDYRPPQNILEMSDEELNAMLEAKQ